MASKKELSLDKPHLQLLFRVHQTLSKHTKQNTQDLLFLLRGPLPSQVPTERALSLSSVAAQM